MSVDYPILYPILDGELEIRARGDRRVLSGRFPYNRTATVRSSGPNRKSASRRVLSAGRSRSSKRSRQS